MVSQKEIAKKKKFKTGGKPTPKLVGGERVTKKEFEQEKRKELIREPKDITAEAQKLFAPQPAPVAPQQPIVQQAPVTQPVQQEVPDQSLLQNIGAAIEGRPIEIGGRLIQTGLRGTEQQEQAGVTPEVLGGSLPIAGGIGVGAVPVAYRIGKEVITNPKKVVQTGNALKNSKAAGTMLDKLKEWGGIGALALGVVGFPSLKSFLDKTPEQQQALNTLGQTTSSIVGDSISSAGDYRRGLAELNNIEQRLLELESNIKSGGIASQTIKVDGRIIDINSDIEDQLKTIREGRTDIQSFVLQGNFPEMSDFEIQEELFKLEQQGIITREGFEETRR